MPLLHINTPPFHYSTFIICEGKKLETPFYLRLFVSIRSTISFTSILTGIYSTAYMNMHTIITANIFSIIVSPPFHYSTFIICEGEKIRDA